MKNTLVGILAATLLATPAFAWKAELFNRLDTDASRSLTVAELEATGCHVDKKLFAYADANRDASLSEGEFFNNREFFRRCK